MLCNLCVGNVYILGNTEIKSLKNENFTHQQFLFLKTSFLNYD